MPLGGVTCHPNTGEIVSRRAQFDAIALTLRRAALSELLGNNTTASEIDALVADLKSRGLVATETRKTGNGRPTEFTRAILSTDRCDLIRKFVKFVG